MPTFPLYPNWLRALGIVTSIAILLGLLSWAKALLIPIVLAILLTFALSPIVTWLQRHGLGRIFAVITVVVVVFSFLAGIGWLLSRQFTSLVDTFPKYRHNITEKIAAWNASGKDGIVEKSKQITTDILHEIKKTAPKREPEPGVKEPLPVMIVDEGIPLKLSDLWSFLVPILEPFATAGLTLVLLIFMLTKREDLRDRLISLIGSRRITLTTKALDEASERISRYLLVQLVINGGFGATVALGLFLIGLPYALAAGFFAAILRYIPYVGPWLGALLPFAVSVVVSENWMTPLLVLGLFASLELIINMVLEPWLYGRGIGVSQTATLVMIAFWTWLWGPVGLILATPLTACLVVIGKYVPFLASFDTILGNKPALEPSISFYQRLLARDQDEAADIAEDYLKIHSLEQTYDGLLIPALIYTQRNLENRNLTDDDQHYILGAAREVVEQIAALPQAAPESTSQPGPDEDVATVLQKVRILGCPARSETDEVALLMLKELLDSKRYDITLMTNSSLVSDVVALVEREKPALICIAALPPGGIAHTRLICLRLRARFPGLKIVVGRWGLTEDLERNQQQLLSAGADEVGMTFQQTRNKIESLAHLASPREREAELEHVS